MEVEGLIDPPPLSPIRQAHGIAPKGEIKKAESFPILLSKII
jgi:hypothetical protein